MEETIGYQLSIGWPDGETMVAMESPNTEVLLQFLSEHAHEAGTICLMKRTRQLVNDEVVDKFVEIEDDLVWAELGGE